MTETRNRRVKQRAVGDSPVLRGGMPRALGVRVTSLTRKRVTAELRIRAMHLNVDGRVNGGAIMAFADVAAAAGAVANRPPGHRGGTIESKANFFAAGTGPVLKAVSIPLHVGRTTSVWQTTVSNPDGRAIAVVTQTQFMIPVDMNAADGNAKVASRRLKRRRGK